MNSLFICFLFLCESEFYIAIKQKLRSNKSELESSHIQISQNTAPENHEAWLQVAYAQKDMLRFSRKIKKKLFCMHVEGK